MIAHAHPAQEKRLRALYDYDILDTPREADFDEIVALASRICEAPISVVNLIDKDRQWFKAEVGLNARETPLDTSICSHAILQDDFIEIPDTLADARMADNPLCTAENGLRFYAGSRLLSADGLPIGTLCILDTKPRRLTDLQRNALQVLSRQVMKQLDLRRALRNQATLLHEADHRVKNSLQTLTSIVRLYGRKFEDPHAKEALDAIQRRIAAVGALHGELQSSQGLDQISAQLFMTRVVDLLQETAPENIALTCDVDKTNLSPAKASALGMIVSEFVANAIKHGFPGEVAGQIDITLRLLNGKFTLTCRDNGAGSNAAAQKSSHLDGLGSSLMAAAASQLGATLESDLTPQGSRLSLTF